MPVEVPDDLWSKLSELRAVLDATGHHSHTSRKFQNDLIGHVCRNFALGDNLVEVGCYRGGLSTQLALVASYYGLHVHLIDIDANYLQIAGDAIKSFGLSSFVSLHLMNFPAFVDEGRLRSRAVLILIDGDHRYEGVVADIRALLRMQPTPLAAAFHDFSLRYDRPELSNVRVDRAIHDEFGSGFDLEPIGEIAGPRSSIRVDPSPQDGHYHEAGLPEGVLIALPNLTARSIDLPVAERFRKRFARIRKLVRNRVFSRLTSIHGSGHAQLVARVFLSAVNKGRLCSIRAVP